MPNTQLSRERIAQLKQQERELQNQFTQRLIRREVSSVIMLLVGLLATAMPVIHMKGVHYGEIAKSTGGFFFVWTLWALGALGGVTFMLSVRRPLVSAKPGITILIRLIILGFFPMLRKLIALLALVALLASPAAGFDSYWHSQASRAVGQEFGFSEDAWKIMQLGCFAPDLFGPVSDFANERLQSKDLKNLNQYGSKNVEVRRSANFLHFDNLNGELTRNSQLDRVFAQLLRNSQTLLANINTRPDLDDRTRKVLALLTLGASLHAVQDFYSHSDWIHNAFNNTAVKMVSLAAGGMRAPTWYEFRDKSGAPDLWPFRVSTGIYPPPGPDVANTHTHMNHDNSRLVYKEYETPGAPVLSEAAHHNAGPMPAHEDDALSVTAHQKLAEDTAIAASIEWVQRIEENGEAKAAIERARRWNLKASDPKLYKELQAGIAAELALSCAAGRWDGEDSPGKGGGLCRSVLDRKFNPLSASSGAQLESEIIGLAAGLALPWALKFSGKFWDVYAQYQLLEQLTSSIGDNTGHYTLTPSAATSH